ncbi:MAG: nucleotidyltransferase domain-containing protein [Burkholderiales bacterium]|jgi:predicted nucleotidyltransferase|nr:nucleotidyltransferase domain-containing protein [Burkholderiales bacterium]
MINKYGVSDANWQKIIEIFMQQSLVERVVLFGSRAKGNYRGGSDIDLCLYGNISLAQIYILQDLLDDLMLPYKFDLIVYNTINNPELIEHIERVGVVLYAKE